MRKILFLLAACLLSIAQLQATTCSVNSINEETAALTVWLTSGEKVSYWAEELPEFKLVDDYLQVSSMSVNVAYEAKDVQKFSLETKNTETAIKAINQSTEDKPLLLGGYLIIQNGEPGSSVVIVNTNGISVANYTIGADGRLNVNLSTLPRGTFVVKTCHNSIKLSKK